jgi:hypothetical protein
MDTRNHSGVVNAEYFHRAVNAFVADTVIWGDCIYSMMSFSVDYALCPRGRCF